MSTGPRLFLNLGVSITRGIWKIIAVTPFSTTLLCGRTVYNLNARGQAGHRKAEFAGPVHLLLCVYLTHALALSGERAMSGKGPSCVTHKAAYGDLTLNRVSEAAEVVEETQACATSCLGFWGSLCSVDG